MVFSNTCARLIWAWLARAEWWTGVLSCFCRCGGGTREIGKRKSKSSSSQLASSSGRACMRARKRVSGISRQKKTDIRHL
ncbi:uncharacterized protein IWZ02DRAFT_450666 [Phyllosticta citriasiana]|uniref:uncharacterized protein n=1 Tax=Phyllosticta citriasiana TaxID=595635 RepID=UPI0030FD8398